MIETFCRVERYLQGIEPEVVPSKFEEDLPKSEFENLYEYPVANATHKVGNGPNHGLDLTCTNRL